MSFRSIPLLPQCSRNGRRSAGKLQGTGSSPSHVTDRCFHASPIQQDYIRPAAKRLGLEGVGWHAFRHTYRTWLDEVGAPIGVQQKLMRHAQPSTTMNYGNSQMKAKRDANSKVVRMALHATGRKNLVA